MNSSIKNCPFCKNQIPIHSDICPVCKMVLVERIITNFNQTIIPQHNPSSKEKEPEVKGTPKQTSGPEIKETYKQDPEPESNNRTKPVEDPDQNYFNYIISPKFDKYYNIIKKRKVIILSILVVIIAFVFFINHKSGNTSVETINENENSINLPEKYYSNGHVFESNRYSLQGQGLLNIKNGTSYDAVAKLVNIATHKSVLTIYIRRNSDLNIEKINDGNYRLYFVLGKNYDENQNIFLEDCSYSVFEEVFNFITYSNEVEGGENINYSLFEVTLHPVIGGTARTNTVSKEEFISL
ncbi:MAG: hypothetical protein P4L35_01465 [Ignavibacteriaceae bacterium]|nr:hypothetical protein [Ignavibacteriaceae bacterium]